MAELVAHLKYMWVEQRTGAYDARKPRAQQQGTMSGHQLVRMDARSMCEYALSANLLDDNFGSACRNPKCAEYAEKWGVHGGTPVQGKLCARTDVFAVKRSTAWRKCTSCRYRHTVQQTTHCTALGTRLRNLCTAIGCSSKGAVPPCAPCTWAAPRISCAVIFSKRLASAPMMLNTDRRE